jgi:hypothetical protein
MTGRKSLLGIFAAWLAVQLRRRGRQVRTALVVVLRFALLLGSFALLSVAGWQVSHPLGLAIGGVSLLVLEWSVKRQ